MSGIVTKPEPIEIEISIVEKDSRWVLGSNEAKSMHIPLNSQIDLRILNDDALAHYIRMDDLDLGDLLLPGESATVQFTADAEKVIEFTCSLHREAMTIDLTVRRN